MNSFFGLGPMELLVIVFLALIVLGPQRLPGTIREVMKYWRYFRNLSGELTSQLGEEFKDLEDLNPQRILEDLANELDDEVEQTKDAASLKKKPAAKKTTTASAKRAASGTDAGNKKADNSEDSADKADGASKQQDAEEPEITESAADDVAGQISIGDATAAATASAAAAAALSKSASDGVGVAQPAGGETSDAQDDGRADTELEAVEAPAQNGDLPAGSDETEPAAESTTEASVGMAGQARPAPDAPVENTILPPEVDSSIERESEPAAADVETDLEHDEGGQGDAAFPPREDGADGLEGEEQAVNSKTTGLADPATVSANGKGARPGDEG